MERTLKDVQRCFSDLLIGVYYFAKSEVVGLRKWVAKLIWSYIKTNGSNEYK